MRLIRKNEANEAKCRVVSNQPAGAYRIHFQQLKSIEAFAKQLVERHHFTCYLASQAGIFTPKIATKEYLCTSFDCANTWAGILAPMSFSYQFARAIKTIRLHETKAMVCNRQCSISDADFSTSKRELLAVVLGIRRKKLRGGYIVSATEQLFCGFLFLTLFFCANNILEAEFQRCIYIRV